MSYFGVYMPPTEAGFKGTITQCAGSIAAEEAEKDIPNPRKLKTKTYAYTIYAHAYKYMRLHMFVVNTAFSCLGVINARVFNVMTPCYFSFVAHRSCSYFLLLLSPCSRLFSSPYRDCYCQLSNFYIGTNKYRNQM